MQYEYATVTSLSAVHDGDRAARGTTAADIAFHVLEEIDYGLIMVDPEGVLQHANHLARLEMARARFLRVAQGSLCGPSHEMTADLRRAVLSAARGRRQLLDLRHGVHTLPVACVPLSPPYRGHAASVLLLLARQHGTENLSLTFYARAHGLTPAEERVLRALCEGLDVQEIATLHGVAECTVRAQVRALRDKTRSSSIRQLVQHIAALPPVLPVSLAAGLEPAAQSRR